ncbi:TonB-dependent receptor plug domain-containing protein, partial [Acinetobacter baumannii]
VLVDGRRHVSGLDGSQAVDVNTIPEDLIERVDILTGGASAIYGADAVSGVVNFVMKKRFSGLTVRGQSGISRYGDAGNKVI